MNRPKLIPKVLLFSMLLFQTQAYAQIILDSCQVKARKNYPLIHQYDLIEQSKEFSLANAGKSYLPQLDVSLIGGVIDGLPTVTLPGQEAASGIDLQFITMLQLNQMIWDGGITKAKKNAIEASSAIETAELDVALYGLEDRVNNLFFGILLIDEQIEQLSLLRSTLQRNKERVEVAVANGAAFKSDIDEIQVEVINTTQRIDELSYNRKAYVKVLAVMIGEPLEEAASFQRPILVQDYKTMEINRPELRLFNNKYALIEAKQKIEKATLYPKIGLMGFTTFIQPGVAFGTSTVENILLAGLSVNWSLGGIYKNKNNNKLTQVNLEMVDLQRQAFLFNTNLNLSQLGQEMEKFESIIQQDKDILELKTSIKKSYDVKYENGICTLSELLDKVNEESLARQSLIVHEIQYLMKLYEYQNKSGN